MPMYMVLPREIKLKRLIIIHFSDKKFYFLETNPKDKQEARGLKVSAREKCGGDSYFINQWYKAVFFTTYIQLAYISPPVSTTE